VVGNLLFVSIKGLIPVAGIGKRMAPLTNEVPKELLPYGDSLKPMLWHILNELKQSGVKEVGLVLRKGKESVREFVEREFGGKFLLRFLYQEAATGLVDALLSAKRFLKGEDFLLVFPDQLLKGKIPATKQLLSKSKRGVACSSIVRVPKEEKRYFPGTLEVKREWRTFGRGIIPFEIFKELSSYEGGDSASYRKAFLTMTKRIPHHLVPLEGEPRDLGTLKGYEYYFFRDSFST